VVCCGSKGSHIFGWASLPVVDTVEPERRPQVAGIVLLRDDGAALLQHRDNKPGLPHADLWVFPGGHCDRCESAEDCAVREFLEETGYRCDKLHACAFIEDLAVEAFPSIDLLVFWADYDRIQAICCFEGQELKFIERSHAHMYAIPDYLIGVWDKALAGRAKKTPVGRDEGSRSNKNPTFS